MAWYDIFDEETDDWYDSADDGWGITYDAFDDDSSMYSADDIGYYDDYDDSVWSTDYDYQDDSWYDNLGTVSELGEVSDRWDTSFGGQANNWTGIGTVLGNLKRGNISPYTNKGSLLGGLLGGKDGVLGGDDLVGLLGGGLSAWQQSKANDRYNEMMQPLTDLYKAQAADVRQRRANRDANIAGEYDTWESMMQPGWDRRDQKAENLRHKQGKLQSSSAAWDRAANEQFRDLTKTQARQNIANLYDERTGMLGGQLSGLNPWDKEYGQRQQNPYINMGLRGLLGV